MTIVVTGGNGHLGQWTIAALTTRGYDVINLSRQPRNHPTIRGVAWSGRVGTLVCDLSDSESIKLIQRELSKAGAVVHLSAHIPGNTAQNNDDDACNTLQNVFATIGLLGALKESIKLRALVYASTFEVYGVPRHSPVEENHPTEPLTYYGASKLACEKYVELFSESKKIPCSSLRFPAIYGPGDNIKRAIGNFIRSAVAGTPIEIYGDGEDLRDMVYVADAALAIVKAIEMPAQGIFNIGNGVGMSIREMAETVRQLSPKRIGIIRREREKPRLDYVLDVRRAETVLGWRPATTIKDGIRAQLGWAQNAET